MQEVDTQRPRPEIARDSLALARLCAQVLDGKKVKDVGIFDVRTSLQITDYFVLGSGLHSRQIKAACKFLEKELRESGVRHQGIEGYREGKWVLLDYGAVVVHLLLDENRRYYDLEMLWGDSPRVEWTPLTHTG